MRQKMSKVETVTFLFGSSGVGKTTLVNLLRDSYGFHAFKCSAFDAVQTVPHLLKGGKADYDKMVEDIEHGLEVQEAIGVYFKMRMTQLLESIAQNKIAEKHIVTERSLYDPMAYTITYMHLHMMARNIPIPTPIRLVYDKILQSLRTSMRSIRNVLEEQGVTTSVVYIPINRNYPYDMLNGVRPSAIVRDTYENKAIHSPSVIPKPTHRLHPNEATVYAEIINTLVSSDNKARG